MLPVRQGWRWSQPARGWRAVDPCGRPGRALCPSSPLPPLRPHGFGQGEGPLGAGALRPTASVSQAAATTPHSPSRRTWTSPSPSSPALTSCVWSGTQWTPCRYAARGWGLCAELGGLTGVPGRQARKGRSTVVDSMLVLSPEVLDFCPWPPPSPGVATLRHCLPSPLASRCSSPTPAPPLARALRPWCWSPGLHPHSHPAPLSEAAVCADTGGPASARPPLPHEQGAHRPARSPPRSSVALPRDLALGLHARSRCRDWGSADPSGGPVLGPPAHPSASLHPVAKPTHPQSPLPFWGCAPLTVHLPPALEFWVHSEQRTHCWRVL